MTGDSEGQEGKIIYLTPRHGKEPVEGEPVETFAEGRSGEGGSGGTTQTH